MRLRALAFFLVVMQVPVDLPAQDPPEYTLAVQLVQQQHWAEALSRLKNLRNQYPGNPKVGNLEGLALLGSGRPEEAAAAFQLVLAKRPDFVPALKNLALLEWQTKKPRAAAAHTEQALRMAPRDKTLNAYAALSDLQKKNASAASQHLDLAGDAIAAMPPALEMQLAYLLGINGLYRQAVHVYQDIAAHGGHSPALTYNLALAAFLAGSYEETIRTLEEAESSGHTLDNLTLLAQAYEKNNQTQLAIDRLREAITLVPDQENSYLDLATICIDHNAYPLGIEIVQLGLEHKPKSEKLLFQLGVLHALSGNFDLARDEFRRARRLAPGNDLPIAALALADIQNGRHDALQELRRNLKQKGDSAILYYLLGSSLVRNGARPGTPEYAEARVVFQKAIRLDPKLPYPYIELGKMYEQAGKILEAIPLFQKAAVLGPRDPSSYYHLARDYQRLHQTQKAALMLSKVKEIENRSREFERIGLTSPEG